MSEIQNDPQRDLFPPETIAPLSDKPQPPMSRDASLQAALGVFEIHMRDQGFSIHTIKAFASDIRLLAKYLGPGQPVGEIGTKNLNNFLDWLLNERGVPCSPKSYARRVTTIKVFFGWLHDTGVINENPSAAVIQRTVTSPLPKLPNEDQIEQALLVTQTIREGTSTSKADARPQLLLTLLLQSGIKKGEAMNLVPNHVDRNDADEPMLFVRYANPNLRYKERKLPLDPNWLIVFDEYLAQYQPPDTLFTCTARNLEYVLRDIGDAAELDTGLLSFENLRWVSALRDWRAGEEKDDIRQKLGLSKITWRETKSKLEKLSRQETDD